jgi:hypothetical protein
MDVETFKTDVIVFYQLHYNVFEVTLTDNFQCQSQFVNTDNIIQGDQTRKCPNYR